MQQEDVFQSYKPLLFSIAYNMLGSVMDAEDCVQEAFLRWYQASDKDHAETVRSPKAYLCTTVTHLCIDHLRSARVQRESYVGVWLPEPLVSVEEESVTSMAELSETLSVAFLHLLEELNPVERAVFLLHQIFDYDYAEIATMVQKSEANCRQILRRAHQHLSLRRPLYSASREQQDTFLHQFLSACTNGDMDGLLALLANDVVAYSDSGGKVPAARNPVYGADKVARFFIGLVQKWSESLAVRVAHINGQPGIIIYVDGFPYAAMTLDVADGRIREIDIVANPEKLRGVSALV